MDYQLLGGSDLNVSRICLGTMTFGQQNTEVEAHQQLDYAVAEGINFFDTAEMYPVPPNPATQGLTEAYIGRWIKARGNREQIILATKVSGPAEMASHIRPDLCLNKANIRQAITDSLQRLQTDYIDLYQLHWPERATNFFGQLNYRHQPELDGTPILETLTALKELVDEGLIRYVGLSNEVPWGVMKFLSYADALGLPRVVSVQNPYNLLNRKDEVALSEVLLRENVALMAYSPLAFGTLSGKYLDGSATANDRINQFPRFARYFTDMGLKATAEYVLLAREHGLDPAQMALAFVNQQPFVGSNIIGATTLAQLESNIRSMDITLSAEVLEGIQRISTQYSNPCP
ncbi:NADP(H)-dependent aldo-keto reductase [Amphritea sp. 1_MG-2023]|uniref:NADP(H)-dependent aldo-keto reductase n=1 Tax=Amphritea sp. 1_MG-2023 TaxID=3062670 RepID=UPI0026E3E426|nr:NADP(H)-dependent aldo-keto reductase [Amphritea sp. 1_MG-2023]MDO6565191.1 NADP(H)-dependent aldo-keto reductase [Amphritea sp. 1_MG-2023]